MAHPQSTNRGFIAAGRVDVGATQITANSTGLLLTGAVYPSAGTTVNITANSTGIISSGAIYPSAAAAGSKITANSTGIITVKGIYPTAGAGGLITANSTAVIASALRIGTLASYITADSTGIKLGSLYISANSTGNTTT